MIRITVALTCVLIVLASCQKELSVDQGGTPATGTGTNPPPPGGGTGTGNSNSYHPVTTGSWWRYKDTADGSLRTQTLINSTTLRSGITLRALMAGSDTMGFIASPAPNYYQLLRGSSPTAAPFDLLIHYLNDTASVGHSWEFVAGHANGFPAYMKTFIVARDLTMTVEGKTYTNVIHSHIELTYDMGGVLMSAGTYDYFTARGVGVIKVRAELGFTLRVKTCLNLVEHEIK